MIDDFGEKIPGAAKDRRARAVELMSRNVSFHLVAWTPLAEIFPTPDYAGLIDEGASTLEVSTLRALRESIPTKPGGKRPRALEKWCLDVLSRRHIARQILTGQIDHEMLRTPSVLKSDQKDVIDSVRGRVRVYMAFGHETSMKGWEILPFVDNLHWQVREVRVNGMARRPFSIVATRDEAVRKLREHVLEGQKKAPRKAKTKLAVYQYKNRSLNAYVIGRKNRGQFVELAAFDTDAEAHQYYRENLEALEERYRMMAQAPDERGDVNQTRQGEDYLQDRQVTVEMFEETFGFRGVQFGNYMSPKDRQDSLDNAYVALLDLASILRLEPSDLSLRGTLALAFGARGKGGRHAAAAHYEPVQAVINLTKHAGAGSLAHEWFHALDNSIPRAAGAVGEYATTGRSSITMAPHLRAPFHGIIRAIAKTDLAKRSAKLDCARSTPYWSTPLEMAARSFEAWVVEKLAECGVQNDYLANFLDEATYEAGSKLMGTPEGRYPYPREDEMDEIGAAFDTLFNTPNLVNDGLTRKAVVQRDVAPSDTIDDSAPHAPQVIEAQQEETKEPKPPLDPIDDIIGEPEIWF